MNPAVLFDRTLLKFMLVGVINTIVGSAIMFLLYNLAGFSYWMSTAVNYVLASILSFFLNKYFTFRAKNWSFKMIAGFALTIVCAYIIAYSIAKPVIYALLENYSQKVRDNVSMILGMCLFTGLNYLGQRFVAFRKWKNKRSKEDD